MGQLFMTALIATNLTLVLGIIPKENEARLVDDSTGFDSDNYDLIATTDSRTCGENPAYTFAPSLDGIPNVRQGQASHVIGCSHIQSLPPNLRHELKGTERWGDFYAKNTHAYGIPVLGSKHASEESMKKICFRVATLFASNQHLRNAYYKLHGRVAVIADQEETTDIPEHSHLNSAYWNERSRGLGPTHAHPMTTAGGSNVMCSKGQRYWHDDIIVHELGHAVQMAAEFVMPGFSLRLQRLWLASRNTELWNGTYGGAKPTEYFAVAGSLYHGTYWGSHYKVPDGELYSHKTRTWHEYMVEVRTRALLKRYDPTVVALLDEVHPCGNVIPARCDWIREKLGEFRSGFHRHTNKAAQNCEPLLDLIFSNDVTDTALVDTCKFKAMSTDYASGFNFVANGQSEASCRILRCSTRDLPLMTDKEGTDFYHRTGHYDVQADDFAESIKMNCMVAEKEAKATCSSMPVSKRETCGGGDDVTQTQCVCSGCCWDDNLDTCFYPDQLHSDTSTRCPGNAAKGNCEDARRKTAANCGNSCYLP